ncbi:MAG: hypothetical protein WC374_02545 [Phycisphaerae bacterium]|jgi:hypothetical protein
MSNQPRVAKVLVALLASMTVAAILLLVMGSNPPSAGPFSLSTYYRLDPISNSVISDATQSADRWNCIEIYYSGSTAGNIEQLASLSGITSPDLIDCHFVVCNGLGGSDGQVETTARWKKQWSVLSSRTWYGTPQTIRICVVGDANHRLATSSQIRRVEHLVDTLARKFDIEPASIYYPGNWQ